MRPLVKLLFQRLHEGHGHDRKCLFMIGLIRHEREQQVFCSKGSEQRSAGRRQQLRQPVCY